MLAMLYLNFQLCPLFNAGGAFMQVRHISQKVIGAAGFIAAAQLAKFIKISMVIGSYTAFFSLNNCLLPLAGTFLGMGGAAFITCGKMFLGMAFFGGVFPLSYLAFYIPGFFAAAYWASDSIFIRVIVPLSCMLLFIAHPVGGSVWVYAMYWWIPVILYFMKKNNLLSTALGSTFIAHAVGSVIWLYTVPMAASAWLALLPMVIIERLLFAVGAVGLYKAAEILYATIAVPWIVRIRRSAS
jgi:hypothetical protein